MRMMVKIGLFSTIVSLKAHKKCKLISAADETVFPGYVDHRGAIKELIESAPLIYSLTALSHRQIK